MIAIIDYGMGNLLNVKRGFSYFGLESEITQDKNKIENASKVVLPGVGAYPDAMERLKITGLDETIYRIVEKGVPFMGICLGMQMMFEKSMEGTVTEGLGLFQGTVEKIEGLPKGFKVPHMGWNTIHVERECTLLPKSQEGMAVYFVHSYYAKVKDEEDLVAWADYGMKIPAVVAKENVFGIQFHPEKSGEKGLKIYERFGGYSE